MPKPKKPGLNDTYTDFEQYMDAKLGIKRKPKKQWYMRIPPAVLAWGSYGLIILAVAGFFSLTSDTTSQKPPSSQPTTTQGTGNGCNYEGCVEDEIERQQYEDYILDKQLENEGVGRSSGCVIKGNVSYNTGERIYHLPSDPDYSTTTIDPNYGERWFCSEREAQAAGWRHAAN